MKTIKAVFVLLTATLLLTASAHAWFTYGQVGNWPVHERLAGLSLDKIHHTKVFDGINLRAKADALTKGAAAPDRNKIWWDHEATFRVRNTMCAAGNEKDPAMRINRIARGFHYLADNGDPTAGRYKDELQETANYMLRARSPNEPWYFKNIPQWNQYNMHNDRQIQNLKSVADLVKSLRDMARFHKLQLESAMRVRNMAVVKDELMRVFSYIRACQNRLVDILVAEYQNGDYGECKTFRDPNEDVRQVKCSTVTKSGADAPATIHVWVGKRRGRSKFSYELYEVKDRMIVYYAGRVLHDTGCTNGSRTIMLNLSGWSDYVTVKVLPACEKKGTKWNFKVECPY
jgi:hypothetical protein